MNCLQLLDLPPVWLGSILLAVKPTSDLKALFMTCNKLRQLIFSQPVIWPQLIVKPCSPGADQPLHDQALAMAEAAGTQLHLELQDTCASKAFIRLLLRSAAAFHQLQQPQQPPAPPLTLRCISAVCLHSSVYTVTLDSFLSDVLVQHCPNLQLLELKGVDIAAQYRAPQLICTSLQKLSLNRVGGVWSASEESVAGFKQQLLNHMPNLTALELYDGYQFVYEEANGVFWAAIAKYSSQLKALCCHASYGMLLGLPWSLNTQLPLLQELDLGLSLTEDAHMQQLLQSAPGLKRLSLHTITGLTRSFAHVPCSWQELKLNDLYLPELAKLPLSNCTRLECMQRLFMHDKSMPEPSLEQVTAAVNAAQAAGGLNLNQQIVRLVLSADDLERLTAAAPLLQHTPGEFILELANRAHNDPGNSPPWSDYRPQLAVLGQHLKCRVLQFYWKGWTDNPGAAAQLPELLPHVDEFVFDPTPPKAELVQMVCTATRRFTLKLEFSDDDLSPNVPLTEQLKQAMQEAGHDLVNVKFTDEDYVEDY